MEYGYYTDIEDIFDATGMQESTELALERLIGQIEESEEQIDEMSRDIERLSRKLDAIKERLDEICAR